jgi:hypothetical protein
MTLVRGNHSDGFLLLQFLTECEQIYWPVVSRFFSLLSLSLLRIFFRSSFSVFTQSVFCTVLWLDTKTFINYPPAHSSPELILALPVLEQWLFY